MNNEITTEILANAVDATKKSVKIVSVEKTLKLEIEGQKKEFKLVNKAASSNISQLNAMAIAPVNSDGTVDYNNCAVAYAGTNTWGETGRNGPPSRPSPRRRWRPAPSGPARTTGSFT